MLGRGVLSRLHCLTQQESFTLTLYVDLDQNKQSNRNRGFVVQAEAMLKELRAKQGNDSGLKTAAVRALELVGDLEPQGRAALVVVHSDSGLAEAHQLGVATPVSAHWRRGAYLRPVVEAMDEHERYGVVLADTQRARLFTLYMGELVEHSDLSSDTSQRTSTTGTDHWWSQKRFQRHHDQEVTLHAKRVVDALHDLALRAPFDRLVVAGPVKVAGQLARLLPRRLHGKLVETVNLPVTATRQEVLERVLDVQRAMERTQEKAQVDGLLSELHDGGKAVAGLEPVVDSINQGRVWTMFYRRGFVPAGAECRSCGSFAARDNGSCGVCGAGLSPIPLLVDRLSQAVLESGGRVELVDGEAGQRLQDHGSIAALLRY